MAGNINTKNIFLIDAIGALLSALLLIFLIAQYQSFFGFPSAVALQLSILPMIFFVYSFTCHLVRPVKFFSPLSKTIAGLNVLYCCLSIALVVYFYNQISVFGIFYFSMEKLIVLCLAIWEWKVSVREGA